MIEYLTSPGALDLRGFKIEGPAFLVIPACIAFILVFIASCIWLYKDAQKRGKNGVMAILFVALTGWPASFIWWLWLRPSLANGSQRDTSQPVKSE
jgi:hypothetical protein